MDCNLENLNSFVSKLTNLAGKIAIMTLKCGQKTTRKLLLTMDGWLNKELDGCHGFLVVQPFLGRPLYFHNFFTLATLNRAAPFFRACLFLCRYHKFFFFFFL